MAPATDDVIAALDALRAEVEACTLCDLHASRTRGVPGEGDPGADLMFVGEAPGYHEDQQGRPFVGQAGKLLEQLLESIGLTREQVFIANVLKSRPPGNRDPRPEEIAACQPYLWRQIGLIKPKVVCTLGNFATKLLSGDQTGITRVHGRPRATEIGGHSLYLFPIFHPAAALYTPAMLTTLKEDFQRLPQLLAHAAPGSGEEPFVAPPRAAAQTVDPPRAAVSAADLGPAAAATGDPLRAASPVADPAPAAVPAVAATPAAGTPPAGAGADPAPPSGPEQLGLF